MTMGFAKLLLTLLFSCVFQAVITQLIRESNQEIVKALLTSL